MTDPRTKLIGVILVGFLAITMENPVLLGVIALLSASALVRSGLTPQWWKRALTLAAFIAWGTVLSQGLFYSEQPRVPWIQIGPVTLWEEGIRWGLIQSLRLLAVSLAGIALAVSTSPDRLFIGLIALRVPYGLAFMAVTALRFVPQVAKEVRTVHQARARRGRPALQRNPLALLRLELMLLQPVTARALRRAQVLAESLDARGFDAGAPRTQRQPLRMALWERMTLAISIPIVGALIAARLLMLLYTSGTLYIPELRELYGFVRDWI